MKVVVAPDYEAMSREAARRVQDVLSAAARPVLGLPTGRTPVGMYSRLRIADVTAFGLDEYVGLAPDDPRSFAVYLKKRVDSDRLRMPSADYEEQIRNAGGMDLLVLGIGTNGHIAFNEPGAPFDSRTRVVNLADSTRQLLRNAFAPDEPPRQGITMGVATILEARRIILLASGSNKAPAVTATLHGPITVENPASALRLHGDVTLIADEAAIG